jgi:protein O-GlcNAc transferase
MADQVVDVLQAAFVHHRANNLREAEAGYRRVLEQNGEQADALYLLGALLKSQGDVVGALEFLGRAVATVHENAPAWIALTGLHHDAQNWCDCLTAAEEVLRLEPLNAEIELMRASAHRALKQFGEAAAAAEKVIAIVPDNANIRIFHANCLLDLEDFDAAILAAKSAVQLAPNSPEAQFILGACFKRAGLIDEAETPLKEALELDPNAFEALNDLANLCVARGDIDRALDCLRRSDGIKPYNLYAISGLSFYIAFDRHATAAQIFEINRDWSRRLIEKAPDQVFAAPAPRSDGRIRIAYIANDFYDNVTSWFIEPVLLRHDRSRFHITCYSGTKTRDHVTKRLSTLVDTWCEISEEDTEGTVEKIRRDNIDIVVLTSFFRGMDRRIVAYRSAPLQVGYCNCIASSGLDTLDYLITEEGSDPKGKVEAYYTEALVRLSNHNTYLPPQGAPQPNAPPCLEKGYVTFGSFNNLAKINDAVITVWSGVLMAVPKSRLILRSSRHFDNPTTCKFFRDRFAACGVDPARLDFQGNRATRQDHLRDMREADITLDPFPCNGGTTSCESLWMGVPLITMEGETYMGRQGVGDLICTTPETYIESARRLAMDPDRLSRLRKSLRTSVEREISNYDQHVLELETAYETMWCRHLQAARSNSFSVRDDQVLED